MHELNPLDQNAAWVGEELFARPDWLTTLDDAARRELDAALRASEAKALEEIGPNDFPLPTLGSRLRAIQESLEHGSGAALIRGVPVERYGEEQARRAFWGLASHLGAPVSQSDEGERLFSVRDAGFADDDPRSRGPMTRKGLTFHSDRCDVIAFLCLQSAKRGGENEVVSTPALYNALRAERPDLLAVLMRPYLYQRHNVDRGNQRPHYEQPIFSFCEGRFASFLMQVLIERAYARPDAPKMTPSQREALDHLQRRAGELSARFRQEPGDLVLLNNLVTLHRRNEFEDHPEPERKRHILRLWLSTPTSRPLVPAFAPTFGATRPGALRGGMRPL
jgi:alpha-ketoglutarate-dependent taurine dioxygenase